VTGLRLKKTTTGLGAPWSQRFNKKNLTTNRRTTIIDDTGKTGSSKERKLFIHEHG
jgi:hypothetical protein